MLGIWLVVSLFSAMWISRVLVLSLAHKKNIGNRMFIGLKNKD